MHCFWLYTFKNNDVDYIAWLNVTYFNSGLYKFNSMIIIIFYVGICTVYYIHFVTFSYFSFIKVLYIKNTFNFGRFLTSKKKIF